MQEDTWFGNIPGNVAIPVVTLVLAHRVGIGVPPRSTGPPFHVLQHQTWGVQGVGRCRKTVQNLG